MDVLPEYLDTIEKSQQMPETPLPVGHAMQRSKSYELRKTVHNNKLTTLSQTPKTLKVKYTTDKRLPEDFFVRSKITKAQIQKDLSKSETKQSSTITW